MTVKINFKNVKIMIVKNLQLGKHTIPVVAEMGKGDIQITNHFDKDYVAISFSDGNKTEIGIVDEFHNGETSDNLDEIPMMLTFTDTKSIDSLISQLELAKKKLTEIQKA